MIENKKVIFGLSPYGKDRPYLFYEDLDCCRLPKLENTEAIHSFDEAIVYCTKINGRECIFIET